MADKDLDKYLENIGINVDEEESFEPTVPTPRDDLEAPLPVPPVLQGEPKERCESFLVSLLLNFDPAYAVEIDQEDEETLNADIYGGDPGRLIGRGGRTLAALEYLTNAVLNRQEDGERIRVNVDVEGYKRRREERLRDTARKVISKVGKSGEAVALEPMNAAERRVVHMEVSHHPEVISESSGDGKARHVVIKPAS